MDYRYVGVDAREMDRLADWCPRSSAFERAGLVYGGWTSAPTRVIRPSNPAIRADSAVVTPAIDAPTTTRWAWLTG